MKKIILFTSIICFTTALSYAQMSLQLTPSNFHGYNVRCFGGSTGAINLTVTGGTSPYTYAWSNGSTTEDISGLTATYYQVVVTDATSATAVGQITLTEPSALTLTLAPYQWPNGYNVSCFNCFNGSINSSPGGGVAAYTYAWSDAVTTQNRTGLGGRDYQLTVTDYNNCTITGSITLTEEPRNDWSQSGNSGSNPPTQFIGTTDSIDVSFKSNATERMRIKANGKILINGFANSINYSSMLVDSSGQLMRVNPNDTTLATPITNALPWLLGGNNILTGTSGTNFLGTTSAAGLVIKTNSVERMRITSGGKVLIGTDVAGDQKFTVAHNNSNGGMALNRLSSTIAKSEIRFERNGTEKWAIGNDQFSDGSQNFFIWDHTADTYGRTRFFIDASGRTFIGFTNLPCTSCTSSTYKLYVEGGIVSRDVKVTAASSFPDYVFAGDYKPMSIYELEQFIKQNKHLPDFPSAKEVEKNEGFEVGDMQVKMLKKIEEQTLYIIDLQRQVDELRRQISNK